jgi:hypothetical protein
MKWRKRDRIKEAYEDYIFHKKRGYLNSSSQVYAYAKKRWGKAWLDFLEENGNK